MVAALVVVVVVVIVVVVTGVDRPSSQPSHFYLPILLLSIPLPLPLPLPSQPAYVRVRPLWFSLCAPARALVIGDWSGALGSALGASGTAVDARDPALGTHRRQPGTAG